MKTTLALVAALTLGAAPALAAPTFPLVTAEDLNGTTRTLPADLPGDPTIVFVAYKQNQQPDVDSWVYGLGLDPAQGPEFVEIPVVGRGARLVKSFVDNGMRSGITDPNLRARTITLYESVSKINEPLGFSGRNAIRVLLVRQNGEVLWSTSGPATAAGMAELKSLYLSNP